TVSRTATGVPSSSVGAYSHLRTASTAASASTRGPLCAVAAVTRPSTSRTHATTTTPLMPARAAAGGQRGGTSFRLGGSGTARPPTLTADSGPGASEDGSGDGAPPGGGSCSASSAASGSGPSMVGLLESPESPHELAAEEAEEQQRPGREQRERRRAAAGLRHQQLQREQDQRVAGDGPGVGEAQHQQRVHHHPGRVGRPQPEERRDGTHQHDSREGPPPP